MPSDLALRKKVAVKTIRAITAIFKTPFPDFYSGLYKMRPGNLVLCGYILYVLWWSSRRVLLIFSAMREAGIYNTCTRVSGMPLVTFTLAHSSASWRETGENILFKAQRKSVMILGIWLSSSDSPWTVVSSVAMYV